VTGRRGAFIVVEGPEGSGKSTLVAGLSQRMLERGIDPVRVREPGGTPVAEAVRLALLDPKHQVAPIAEQLIEIYSAAADQEEEAPYIRMVEGNYEEALRLFIEHTRNGKPLIGFTGLRRGYFALTRFPEYATLESLTQDWLEEQRALYAELTAARASIEDTAHP